MGFWGRGIMESLKIGWPLTGQGMGAFALRMCWFWRERFRRWAMRRIFTTRSHTRPVFVHFLGIPPGACLSLVALILSDRFGALLQV